MVVVLLEAITVVELADADIFVVPINTNRNLDYSFTLFYKCLRNLQ